MRGSVENVPDIVTVSVANSAATGLAQPDTGRLAVAERALHHLDASGKGQIEAWACHRFERRFGAGRAETTVALAKLVHGWRLECTVLFDTVRV